MSFATARRDSASTTRNRVAETPSSHTDVTRNNAMRTPPTLLRRPCRYRPERGKMRGLLVPRSRTQSGPVIRRLFCRPHEPSQKTNARRHVGDAVVAALARDGKPAPVLDLLQRGQVARPVDVAVAQRHLLGCSAGSADASVLGVGVDDPAGQG